MYTTLVYLTVLGAAFADEGSSARWNFEDVTVGKLPAHWSAAKTGEGLGSVWKVVEDETAPTGAKVLAQTSSEGPRPLFNLCVADDTELADLDLTVSFKAVSGTIDQGGGPVWRYRDADNYYVARMNPLEDNVRVYKVVDGKRTQLATASVKAAAAEWHTIRIVHTGAHIQCYLNDKPHLDVQDDTFKEAGKIGMWTKADAVTYFDDLQIKQLVE
jgi:hypothetical protein